jgi:hypothetical protein
MNVPHIIHIILDIFEAPIGASKLYSDAGRER